MSDSLNPQRLHNRDILRGVQCVCGQWWPDYVMRAGAAIMECCGSTYRATNTHDGGLMLSLVHDNRETRAANREQA